MRRDGGAFLNCRSATMNFPGVEKMINGKSINNIQYNRPERFRIIENFWKAKDKYFVFRNNIFFEILLVYSSTIFLFSCTSASLENLNKEENINVYVDTAIINLKRSSEWLELGSQGELITSGGRLIPSNSVLRVIKEDDTLLLIKAFDDQGLYARIARSKITYSEPTRNVFDETNLAPTKWPFALGEKHSKIPTDFVCIWDTEKTGSKVKRLKTESEVWLYQNAALELIRPPINTELFPNPIWVEAKDGELHFRYAGPLHFGTYAIVNSDRTITFGKLAPESVKTSRRKYNIIDISGNPTPPFAGARLPADLSYPETIVHTNGMIETETDMPHIH